MKFAFLTLILIFCSNGFASNEMAKLSCKKDSRSLLTAEGEASFSINLESGESNLSFGVLKLFTNHGSTLTSVNSINNENPMNEAPTFSGIVDFANDSTWGELEALYSLKFKSIQLTCGLATYERTTFETLKGNTYTMICKCPTI